VDDKAIPILPARDLDETVAFYERLGFGLVRRYPHHGYAIVSRGSMELHFFHDDHVDPAHSHAGCYLRVEDARSVHDEWRQGGVERLSALEEKPWRMREFAVVDPSGNLLRVGQPLN
jgi:catechol 2,3-dioxygenase-like lactoylglutathione lyase family enzyme